MKKSILKISAILFLVAFLIGCSKQREKKRFTYMSQAEMLSRSAWSPSYFTGAFLAIEQSGAQIIFNSDGTLLYKYMGELDSVFLTGAWDLPSKTELTVDIPEVMQTSTPILNFTFNYLELASDQGDTLTMTASKLVR